MELRKEVGYTYADYLTWDNDVRQELIDGVIYDMATPSRRHQAISFELGRQVGNYLRGKPCRAYAAPFSVRLNADSFDDTVVEPDLVVVCDMSKLDDKGCVGAPDFVVEILSPSTASKDKVLKYRAYLNAGVREYWIVDPDAQTVHAHVLENGKYDVTIYHENDIAPIQVLEGCEIDLTEVFAE